MSKAIYTGVGGTARKVPKLYVGVNGVARKVKKGYIGVDGVARLFYAPSTRPSRLPAGYTELEYVYADPPSSGYTYIETKQSINNRTKVVLRAMPLNSNAYLIYSVATYDTSGFHFAGKFVVRFSESNSINYSVGFQNITTYGSIEDKLIASNMTSPVDMVITGDGSCSLNGLDYKISTNPGNFNQFSNFNMSKLKISDHYPLGGKYRLYYMQVYQNDVLTMDLVPCKNAANIIGLYDLVGNSLLQATGEYLKAGPEI